MSNEISVSVMMTEEKKQQHQYTVHNNIEMKYEHTHIHKHSDVWCWNRIYEYWHTAQHFERINKSTQTSAPTKLTIHHQHKCSTVVCFVCIFVCERVFQLDFEKNKKPKHTANKQIGSNRIVKNRFIEYNENYKM